MQNIIETIVMLIDMYYHRKRLMKRWRSIKRYQRTGIIGYKPSGLPISKNPPPPQRISNKPKESDTYKLNFDILSYLDSVGAKANFIHNSYYMRDVLAFDVTYKNYLKRFEYSDYLYNYSAMRHTILYHIKVFIKQTDLKIEKDRKLLHKKNNPHGLELNKKYLIRHKFTKEHDWNIITISRFTDEGYPWGYEKRRILIPNRYDIKTIDDKWIHNCKQWDEFQNKKKLNNEYQLNESDLKYLRDRGVQFSFGLSNDKGQHSVLKIVYKYKTETITFYNKPLKADIFNSIMDFVKLVDRKETMLGVMGTSIPW